MVTIKKMIISTAVVLNHITDRHVELHQTTHISQQVISCAETKVSGFSLRPKFNLIALNLVLN